MLKIYWQIDNDIVIDNDIDNDIVIENMFSHSRDFSHE
jgi:hypothetical protein